MIEKNSVLLVIDIQQEDFIGMPDNEAEAAKPHAWDCIRNGKKVLDVFRARNCLSFKLKRYIGKIWLISSVN